MWFNMVLSNFLINYSFFGLGEAIISPVPTIQAPSKQARRLPGWRTWRTITTAPATAPTPTHERSTARAAVQVSANNNQQLHPYVYKVPYRHQSTSLDTASGLWSVCLQGSNTYLSYAVLWWLWGKARMRRGEMWQTECINPIESTICCTYDNVRNKSCTPMEKMNQIHKI